MTTRRWLATAIAQSAMPMPALPFQHGARKSVHARSA